MTVGLSIVERHRDKISKELARCGSQQVIDPWTSEITNSFRAKSYWDICATVYAQGYPVTTFIPSIKALEELQDSGRFLIWLVMWRGQVVGIACVEFVEPGVASLVSSMSLPEEALLRDGSTYLRQARTSAAMYRRIIDLFSRPQFCRAVVEGEVRLACSLEGPTNYRLASGAGSQYVNWKCGLRPFLLVVPRYRYVPTECAPRVELFNTSRLYLNEVVEPLWFVPRYESRCGISNRDIIEASHANDGRPPSIFSCDSVVHDANSDCLSLEREGGEHYSTIRVFGCTSTQLLRDAIAEALRTSNFVEVIISNDPRNIETQRVLLGLGLLPLGGLPSHDPGTPATIHYGAIRGTSVNDVVDIDIPEDCQIDKVTRLMRALRAAWCEPTEV